MRYLFILLSSSLLCSSCCMGKVYVRQEAITQASLASVQINTPDPRHDINPFGQRLIVRWFLKKEQIETGDLQGVLKVRYHNATQENIPFEISKPWGSYVFDCLNKDYFDKEGILTYKIEVLNDQGVVEEWSHQLWAELISFDD